MKSQLRERYLPLNYNTTKIEFLACTRRERPIDDYYEEFLKLSRHAHLTEEQTLSRFIRGLEGSLADEVKALRPGSLADALIRSKSKLKSVQKKAANGDKRKVPPFQSPPPFKNPRTTQPQVASFVGSPPRASVIQPRPVQARSVDFNPNPSGKQCYRCGGWGHLRRDFHQMNL